MKINWFKISKTKILNIFIDIDKIDHCSFLTYLKIGFDCKDCGLEYFCCNCDVCNSCKLRLYVHTCEYDNITLYQWYINWILKNLSKKNIWDLIPRFNKFGKYSMQMYHDLRNKKEVEWYVFTNKF